MSESSTELTDFNELSSVINSRDAEFDARMVSLDALGKLALENADAKSKLMELACGYVDSQREWWLVGENEALLRMRVLTKLGATIDATGGVNEDLIKLLEDTAAKTAAIQPRTEAVRLLTKFRGEKAVTVLCHLMAVQLGCEMLPASMVEDMFHWSPKSISLEDLDMMSSEEKKRYAAREKKWRKPEDWESEERYYWAPPVEIQGEKYLWGPIHRSYHSIDDKAFRLCEAIVEALGEIGGSSVVPALQEIVRDENSLSPLAAKMLKSRKK